MGEGGYIGLLGHFKRFMHYVASVRHPQDGPALLKEAAVKQGWGVMFMPHGREVFT